MVAPKKYPDELRARAVRLYRDSDPKPVIRRLAEQLNVAPAENPIRPGEADAEGVGDVWASRAGR